MSLTLVRRTAVAVAAVTTTAGVAAVPVLHADAAARAVTSLSIRAVRPAIAPGRSDVLAGDLHVQGPGSPSGRTVTLEARPQGADSFTPVASVTAGPRGAIHETVTPDVTTRYRWRYAGDTDARPSSSGVATVRVRTPQHPPTRIATSLSIRAARHVVRLDGSDRVTGQLRAGRVPIPHRTVVLVARPAGAGDWTFARAQQTGRRGRVSFRVMPAGDTSYRLVFLGTQLLRPSRSAVVRLVTRPHLTIAADPTLIPRGDSTTISGIASDEGTPLAGVTVRLLGRRAGTRHLRVLSSGTTAADGSVSFTQSPRVTTVYRLRLVRSTGVPAALSPAAVVRVQVPTSLSIRGRSTATGFVVSGVLLGGGHPLAHRTVTLSAQAPGSSDWTTVATATTSRKGHVAFHRSPAPGTGYRLDYAGGPRFAPSSSGTVTS